MLTARSALALNCLMSKQEVDELDLKVACGIGKDSDVADFDAIMASLRDAGLIIG